MFGALPAAAKILLLALAVVLIGWAAKCGYDHTQADAALRSAKRDTLAARTERAEKVYTDIVHYVYPARSDYRAAKNDLLKDPAKLSDTTQVKQVLQKADATIVTDSTALAKADSFIVALKNENKELKKPIPTPRLSFATEGMYDVARGTALVRAGPEYRLVWGFSARAEGEFDQARGFAVRLGVRKTF